MKNKSILNPMKQKAHQNLYIERVSWKIFSSPALQKGRQLTHSLLRSLASSLQNQVLKCGCYSFPFNVDTTETESSTAYLPPDLPTSVSRGLFTCSQFHVQILNYTAEGHSEGTAWLGHTLQEERQNVKWSWPHPHNHCCGTHTSVVAPWVSPQGCLGCRKWAQRTGILLAFYF